jgi:hypothetical protein
MSDEKSVSLNEHPAPAPSIPRHPFFESAGEQASFSQCLDAIDSVNAVIELCHCLKLDGDTEGGLTPMATYGYHWVTILIQGALSYVSDRLIMLNRHQQKAHQKKSAYLSALLTSLTTLDEVDSERFLNSAASHIGITRSGLDQFIHKMKV